MKQKLLELLNAKFLGKGVRKDGLEQLAASLCMTVTTDEEAQALVDKLTDEQVTEFVKDWRKGVDGEVTKGVETYKSKNQNPTDHSKKYGEENTDPANPTNPTDIATIVQNAVKAAVEPFQKRLDTIDENTIVSNRLKTFNDKLADAPEAFKEKALRDYGRMSFKDDEDFNAFLGETETDLTKYNQEVANQANGGFRRPLVGGGNAGGKKDEPSAAVKEYIAEQTATNSDSNPLGGKEV
ncbi:MAG: hypothetical protein ACRC0E_10595 [Soonwooa sp.]